MSSLNSSLSANGADAEPTGADRNGQAHDALGQLYRSHSEQLVSQLARRTDWELGCGADDRFLVYEVQICIV